MISDSTGYYFFEFYNANDRYYLIESLATSSYAQNDERLRISEGEQNEIDIAIKKYIELEFLCINKIKHFNEIELVNRSYFSREVIECENFDTCKAFFHIIPENNIQIDLHLIQRNPLGQIDSLKDKIIEFYSSRKDTTITYYY